MISYSALTSYGKATLPSVESWNGNFDIVRDPPSGIHTRRIIKVGDNNDLLDMNEDSGQRINEMINIYARGNNPMVSVQYSNHGNTGSGLMGVDGGTSGSTMSNLTTAGGGGKLPYRIMEGGAFRPPILRQEDLLPLSRMPRMCTSITSKRCRVDQTKRIKPDVAEYFKYINPASINVSAYSQKSFKKETPPTPPTNIGLMVNNNHLINNVHTNSKKLKDGGDHLIPMLDDRVNVSVDGSRRFPGKQEYIHGELFLGKNVPNHEAVTISNLNIRPNTNIYEFGNGNGVIINKKRPDRAHSQLSATSGATMVKINQDKMINGVMLKSRGIH